METQVLERTIIKIGSLLALGFGEAGAAIIGQNMKDQDNSAAVIEGRKVEAVLLGGSGSVSIRIFCALQPGVDFLSESLISPDTYSYVHS